MENKKEKWLYFFALLILSLISICLALALWYKTSNPAKGVSSHLNDLTLQTMPIPVENVIVKNSYVGFVEAINQVNIVPYISGYLDTIFVKPGKQVKEDDVLVTIEPSEYKAKLDAAVAELARAEASFEYQKNYYERVKKSGKNTFSEVEVDNAKNNFLKAQAELKNAQANKDFANINYLYTQIKAPISGLVGNFNLSRGDYISPPNSSLLSIVQTDPIRVVFSLTDSEYLDFKKNKDFFDNSTIRLTLSNGQDYKYAGAIKYTDNQINKNTNSLAVYAYFKNDENLLLPNSFVTVDVYRTFKDSVLLDKDIVKITDNGYFLNIARDDKITTVPIDIISEKDDKFIIKNIFKPNDLIVLDDVGQIPQNTEIKFKISNI